VSETAQRDWSAIDALADRWLGRYAELAPTAAGYRGLPGVRHDRWDDFSPAGAAELAAAQRDVLDELAALTPRDDIDAVTAAELGGQLSLALARYDAGTHLGDVNVVASPVQMFRLALETQPRSTGAERAAVSIRLGTLGAAVDGYLESLAEGMRVGIVPARRQVLAAAAQARASAVGVVALADGLAGADLAAAAFTVLADFLEHTLAPAARLGDGVGREAYALASEGFLGTRIDLDATYQWGLDQLAAISLEQAAVAELILPGATQAEVMAALDADPSNILHGTDALREWMQRTSDAAIAALSGSTFEIPQPLTTLECMIAPSATGLIYYTGPSDDFSRPGRMWWSVPHGITRFSTWRERTTVYHEGVPGHHLQVGQAVHNRDRLNSWRRLLSGTSGHSEGWALYAERLMDELGFLASPADRFGMLGAQRMRAARVVLDIGVHLGKQRPDGEGVWDAEYALRFMRDNVPIDEARLAFEVDRYLGWPGQAASYLVGQRVWETLRDDYLAVPGADLRSFHAEALALGGVGLDTLRSALLAR